MQSVLQCTSCGDTIVTVQPEIRARVISISAVCPGCNIVVAFKEPTGKAKNLLKIDPGQTHLTLGDNTKRSGRAKKGQL